MTVERLWELLAAFEPYDEVGLEAEMYVSSDDCKKRVRFEVDEVVSASKGPRALIRIDRTLEEIG